ncbi:MAG: efflux RND transporter permease subunit, partial [Planctomycetota bacterium]
EVAQRVRRRVFGSPHERAQFEKQRKRQKEGPKADPKGEENKGDKKEKKGRGGEQRSRPSFLAARLPDGLQIAVTSDQSVFVQAALDDVRSTVLTGGCLAVIVLLVFLKNAWFTLIVGLSIPLSVMAAFIAMHLSGVSINMMSLGGLALGIGMLVDNSVVVLESIFRSREDGQDPQEAAVQGTQSVASAVTASTLTTVAVFLPIVFVEGIAGQIFRDQALTVVISLIASLFVALYFIPSLSCRAVRQKKAREGESPVRRVLRQRRVFGAFTELKERVRSLKWASWKFPLNLFLTVAMLVPVALLRFVLDLLSTIVLRVVLAVLVVFSFVAKRGGSSREVLSRGLGQFDRVFGGFQRRYLRVLEWSLDHRGAVLGICLLAAALSFSLITVAQTELIPEVHQGEFSVEIRLPRSTRIEETDRVARRWEDALLDKEVFPEISTLTTTVGVERDELNAADEGQHSAKFLVRMDEAGGALGIDREEGLKERIRDLVRDAEFESVEMQAPVLFSFKSPIEIEISGYRLDELRRISRDLEAKLAEIPELEDVKSSLARGNPEVQITLDRELLSRYDLGSGTIGTVLRKKIQGEISSYFTLGDRKVPIRVRLEERDRDSLLELERLGVFRDANVDLQLRDVVRTDDPAGEESAQLLIGEGPAEIRRIAHQRAAVVTANLAGMSLGGATESISETIETLRYPPEFSVGFGGQKEEMDRALESLRNALFLAVFLVYVVMAMQFESLVQPLVIIVSIPLAFVGVLPALYLLDRPISIIVFIGAIVLAGIVVNNAIVLIDTANRRARAGESMRDALLVAGELRLRPILMTTSTTVLGLLPLTGLLSGVEWLAPIVGSGQGEEIRAPLAIAVATGLVTSTVLTLVVVPVISSIVSDILQPLQRGAEVVE